MSTTTTHLTLTLPWAPSVNHYLRHFTLPGRTNTSTAISADGRDWLATVGAILIEQKPPQLSGPLAMLIELFPPDRKAIDVDNRAKPIMDALKRREKDKHQFPGAWVFADDDSQVKDLRVVLRNPLPGGTAIVRKVSRGGKVKEKRVRLGGKVIVHLMPLKGAEVQGGLFDQGFGA